MAVGNPFGLENSVSSGIVSGKGRHIGETYDRLIQTDAPLIPAVPADRLSISWTGGRRQ